MLACEPTLVADQRYKGQETITSSHMADTVNLDLVLDQRLDVTIHQRPFFVTAHRTRPWHAPFAKAVNYLLFSLLGESLIIGKFFVHRVPDVRR